MNREKDKPSMSVEDIRNAVDKMKPYVWYRQYVTYEELKAVYPDVDVEAIEREAHIGSGEPQRGNSAVSQAGDKN